MNVKAQDTTEVEVKENSATEPQEAQKASDRPKSMRETILAAIEENKQKKDAPPKKADPEQPKEEKAAEKKADASGEGKPAEVKKAEPKPEDALSEKADKPDLEKQENKKTENQGEDTEKSQSSKPPTAWSRSSKALWDSLPPSIQDEVLRREESSAKGVAELKERHQAEVKSLKDRTAELETAVAPYDEAIRQAGRTRGQVVDQLFKWHIALAGPNKTAAFRQLAANLGVDIAQLAGVQRTQEGHEGSTEAGSPPPQVQDMSWAPAFGELQRRLEQYEAATTAQQQASAEKAVQAWAKDKPHFEKVRQRMAQFINADADLVRMGQQPVSGFIKNGDIDMDAAYEAAVWADPELRAELIRSREEEREAAARAVAEKQRLEAEQKLREEKAKIEAERAKRAAASLKPGAPLSGLNGSTATKAAPSRQESVRDSIRRALQGIQ